MVESAVDDDSKKSLPEADGDEESDAEPRVSTRHAIFRMVVLTVVLLGLVEVGARVAFRVHRARTDAATAADYPPGTYMPDFTARVKYRFINFYTMDPTLANKDAYEFDSFGFRLDKRKLAFDQPNNFKKIWMLGASTVQGDGALGDETIAANLNQLLEDSHSQYRVINMGQGAFTTTQELMLLVELIQNGHRPDLLLEYGGGTAMPFPGNPEAVGGEDWEKRGTKSDLVYDVQSDESISTLLGVTLMRLTRIDDVMRGIQRRTKPAADLTLAGDNWDFVVKKYLSTLLMEKAVADQLDVPSLFFFQPLLRYEEAEALRTFSAEETRQLPRAGKAEIKRLQALQSDSAADLRKRLGGRFFDIHDVFKGQDGKRMYADPRHPTGTGNALIAKRIFDELKKVEGVAPGAN